MPDKDYLKLAKKKEDHEWQTLFKRMDTDKDLVNLAKYTLRDAETPSGVVPHAVSITLNDPAVFATNVESSLNNASEQVVVTSQQKGFDTAAVEQIISACFLEADRKRQLRPRGKPLDAFIDQQNCRKGRSAVRCLLSIKDGVLDADLALWNTRYVTWGEDSEGIEWVSYLMTRTPEEILTQLTSLREINVPVVIPQLDVTKEKVKFRDIWTRKDNIWYVDDIEVKRESHNFDYVPAAIDIVPMGSLDDPEIKYEGESIFFLIRDLIPEINRLASLNQSLNMKELDHALQNVLPVDQVDTKKPPDHDEVTHPGAVTNVAQGGGFQRMPLGELRQQALWLHQMIEQRIQRGSLSAIDLGELNFQLSAVALIEIGEGRDQVFLPRLGTRGLIKKQLAEMMIKQILAAGVKSLRIGRQTYDVSILSADYDIEYKYYIKSPKVDIARFSMAEAAGNLIPNKAKRRDILQRENPDEDERLLRWEEAEQLFPTIKMRRTIKALVDEAERGDEGARVEARMAAAEMGITLKQILVGDVAKREPEQSQKPKPLPLVPLLSAGGSGIRKSPVSNEKVVEAGNDGNE